jgi:putative PIN family toxin of toxin-antitoxin system
MKVMLDTNVLAAAAATRGLCADVLRAVLSEHDLVTCPKIFSELKRVFGDKFGLPQQLVNDFTRFVQKDSIYCESAAPIAAELKDKDDVDILSAAVSGGVDVLVTGAKELQGLGKVAGFKIMSPRQFWQELGKA